MTNKLCIKCNKNNIEHQEHTYCYNCEREYALKDLSPIQQMIAFKNYDEKSNKNKPLTYMKIDYNRLQK